MDYTVKHPFTFPHGKLIRVIFSDQYEDNYISPDLADRLSRHYKATSYVFIEMTTLLFSLRSESLLVVSSVVWTTDF